MSLLHIFTPIALGLVLWMGIATNILLVTVISLDWARRRRLPASDLIRLCQTLTNIAMQCSSSVELLISVVWQKTFVIKIFQKCFFVFYPFLVFSIFWITAWLCVFYCVKITNFAHPAFMRLKLTISGMVPWLLLGTVLAASALCVPAIWELRELSLGNSTADDLRSPYTYSLFYRIFMGCLGCSLPLALILVSAATILTSLYRHTHRMQQNSSGFSGPSMEAHIGAARTVSCMMLLYIIFYVALILTISDNTDFGDNVIFYVSVYLTVLYPFVHALILFFGTPRLKEAASKFLSSGLC